MDKLAAAIRHFEECIGKAGVERQSARIARYALCETADELAATLPGADRQRWAREGMVPTFFNATSSGSGFFEALNKVLGDPKPDTDLLEFLHACLMLGFQGQYRAIPAGAQALRRVENDVLAVLRRLRESRDAPVPAEPQAEKGKTARQFPIWAVGAAAAAVLAATFVILRVLITSEGDAVAASMLALSPQAPVALERLAAASPVSPPKPAAPVPVKLDAVLERVRAAVAAELGKGIEVAENGDFIVVTIGNSLLFAPGSARLNPDFDAAGKRIAAALDAEKGAVRVVGHTDNVKPRKTSAFKSNFDLSLARAEAVKALLAKGFRNKNRLSAEGKGEDEPLADNASPEGRAANRRIVVTLRRDDAP